MSIRHLSAATLLILATVSAATVEATPAQQSSGRLFVGATLAVTAEPESGVQSGGVWLNITPLTLEWTLTDRVAVRAVALTNLDVTGGSLGHFGGSVTLPVCVVGSFLDGWVAGPYVGWAAIPSRDGSDLTVSVEGGPRWRIGESWALQLAFNLGASRLDRAGQSEWVNHIGVNPSVGYWF